MKLNKKLIESAIVLAMTGALSIAAVLTNDVAINDSENMRETLASNIDEKKVTAGVAGVFCDYEVDMATELDELVCVEKEDLNLVSVSFEEAINGSQETENTEENTEIATEAEAEAEEIPTEEEPEVVLTAEEQEWQDKLMPTINDSLNVRVEANADSSLVGKLYVGNKATVLEKGDEWSKITSGNVTGYVKNEYCVFGTDALAYAKETCKTVAKSTTGGLRVRSEQSTDASVVVSLGEGEKLPVNTSAETEDGWVAVVCDSTTAYVSADYVDVSLSTGTGLTVEEEAAKIAEEEAAKQAAAEASTSKSGNTTTATKKKSNKSVAASADEETLLAALIQCEAGGTSYDCQLAVGCVVMNRVSSRSYPNTIYKVIYQKYQFGPARNGRLESVLKKGVSKTSRKAAREALSGVDNTNGAKSFKLTSSGHSGVAYGPIVFY